MSALIEKYKKIWTKLTDQFWRAKCNYIKYYDKLEIDEHIILLESEHGKKVDGNIFYMLRYLSQNPQYHSYKIYLSAMGRYKRKFSSFLKAHNIENINIVMLASDEYMQILASAKYLINDTSFGPYFVKKKGQVYLNTWHGTPLKTLGRSDKAEYYTLANIQKNFVMSDYLLYPNEYTAKHMIEDYMLQNISRGKYILSGYPRNEIFFDEGRREQIKAEMRLDGKRIYAYLPTYRGSHRDGRNQRNTARLICYLYELDSDLTDNEVFYVNLHPLAQKDIDFRDFKHVKIFPSQYEVYEFLNVADVLVTDYSSVFFDYAVTKRKIVLFPYDEEEYLSSRGMYMTLDDLPFSRVYNISDLILELRGEKNYDDSQFLKEFCPYDSANASKYLCDAVVLGNLDYVRVDNIPNNEKENVFIYTGNLSANGITTSLLALLNTIDLSKRNYYLTFASEVIRKNKENLLRFPQTVSYFATTGDMNLTIRDRVIRKLFKKQKLSAATYMKLCQKRVRQDFERCFGNARIDSVIQFNGYEQEVILKFSTFSGNKVIFAHSDMLREIETRHSQRFDVLQYAYREYSKVAVVSTGIIDSAAQIAGGERHIVVVHNAIDFRTILKQSKEALVVESGTRVFPNEEIFFRAMESDGRKVINVGRFSPEKGHERLINAFYKYRLENPDDYLVIMGGNSLNRGYEKAIAQIKDLGIENNVILLLRVSNPYPIIKACDSFILSSFYEGFGLVLAEADILGKPVVSTDIDGARDFMQSHGGTLVENNEAGILKGLHLLKSGMISPMNVDYAAYNTEVVQEFEQVLVQDSNPEP